MSNFVALLRRAKNVDCSPGRSAWWRGYIRGLAGATSGRRGKRGLAIYLDLVAHASLKAIAEDKDKQLKDLLEEGVNLVLQRYGRKPIA